MFGLLQLLNKRNMWYLREGVVFLIFPEQRVRDRLNVSNGQAIDQVMEIYNPPYPMNVILGTIMVV